MNLKRFIVCFLSFMLVGCTMEFGPTASGQYVVRRPPVWCFVPDFGMAICQPTIELCIRSERMEEERPRRGCHAVYNR